MAATASSSALPASFANTPRDSTPTSSSSSSQQAMAGVGALGAGIGSPASSASSASTVRHMNNDNAASKSSSQAPGGSKDRPTHRRRASSIVVVKKIEQSPEELLDQSAGFNANADWVNYKGAWVIHVVLIMFGKILLDVIPGMPQDLSWTLVNLGYDALSFIMFHHVTGTPFDSNAGAYDQLTLWEQIDEGAQYTPAKKWLTSVPIFVFLISTHYTRFNLALFALNFIACLIVVFPKLPILDRLRFRVLPGMQSNFASGANSPYPSRPNTPAVSESHSRGGSAY